MSHENPLWGAPRIHDELLKLGLTVSQATVAKYMARRTTPPSQSWRTFLTNHLQQIAAADFFVVPTATCRLLFVLVILAHERRRVVHVAITDHPTAVWTAQQLREAFPWNEAPRRHPHGQCVGNSENVYQLCPTGDGASIHSSHGHQSPLTDDYESVSAGPARDRGRVDGRLQRIDQRVFHARPRPRRAKDAFGDVNHETCLVFP
jgi:hypothetical protein